MGKLHFLAAMLLAAGAGVANAGFLADVNVIDRGSGERLQVWRHDGRLYVAGRPGDRYAIELTNRSGSRILAVLSVDGINAVTGQTAATRQSGYVLDAGQRTEIAGWRKSLGEVAAFYFTRLPDAYAARTGRPENVGVIGVAVFREYVEPRLETPRSLLPAPSQAPEAKAGGAGRDVAQESAPAPARSEERLGTGHGERVTSPTQYTDFRRASEQPAEVATIYYDSYANLVARGIIPRPRRPEPQPFPGGFVADPG